MRLRIRRAEPADAAVIHRFVADLATYEKAAHEVEATPEDFTAALFAERPHVFCELAEVDGEPAGMALWYYSFSTWKGRHGLYLEDLFVDPDKRGLGVGRALLAALARRCVDEGLPRFEWEVLDWNRPAIDFYEARGAVVMHGWWPVRLSGEALERLAAEAPVPMVRETA